MSYDLVVFEPTKAPRRYKKFIKWYDKESEWDEGHSYADPAVTSPGLRSWYEEIRKTFPAMNGPDAQNGEPENEEIEIHQTDYSIGYHMIYASFAWSLAPEAYDMTKALAQKYKVGFFNVSGSGSEVYLPDGRLMKHEFNIRDALKKLWKKKRIIMVDE